jgi:hypothetical protein
MKRSQVVATDQTTGEGVASSSDVRTSSNAFLERRQDDVIAGAVHAWSPTSCSQVQSQHAFAICMALNL